MLSLCSLTNEGSGSIGNVAEYMKTTEYYRAPVGKAVWLGAGAKALALDEQDPQHALEALLAGFDPANRQRKLVRNAGSTERVMGWDCTFSADKTVSILFAASTPEEQERLLAAHHRAIDAGLAYLQEQLVSNTGARGEGEPQKAGGGLVIRRVDHLDSREGDAQLHSHCVVVNASRNPDGRWRTIQEPAFWYHRHVTGAIYRHQLARELRGLGYGVNSVRELDADGRETGQVWHRVAGIDEDVRKHFSKRRQAILEKMEEDGLTAQAATMQTRRGKVDENNPDAIVERTQTELADLHRAGLIQWERGDELRGVPGQGLTARNVDGLLADLHKTASAFDRRHLIDRLAKERLDVADPVAAADKALGLFEERGYIVRLSPDEQGRERFCSKAQWDLEDAITQDALARKDETTHRLPAELVEASISEHEQAQGFTLTDEQRKAVRFVASETGGVACLSGQAGTGKTATAGAYVRAFRAAGFDLLGTSTAQRAAEKLEAETGVPSVSCAKLLSGIEWGDIHLTAKSVLVVDEAGMVGAKTLRQLQQAADDAGAKLLLLGDALQLQPVEAGAPFRLMTAELGEAKLTEIRRQKQEADREVANAFYGGASGASLVKGWEERDQLRTRDSRPEAVQALVQDVLANPKPLTDKLIIANTHADVSAIHTALRDGLKQRGELRDGVELEVAGKLMGERHKMEICEGERILFKKNDRRLGVANGDVGVVEAITTNKRGELALSVRLESDVEGKNGKRLVVKPKSYDRLGYAYAGTTHAAQGQGKADVYWLASPGQGLDRNMGLVAFTRTKDTFRAYVCEKDKAKLVEKLDGWGTKLSAKEMAPPKPDPAAQAFGQKVAGSLVDLKAWKAKRDAEARAIQHKQLEEQRAKQRLEDAARRVRETSERLEGAERLLVDKMQKASVVEESLRKAHELESEWLQAVHRRGERLDGYGREIERWKQAHPVLFRLGRTKELAALEAKRDKAKAGLAEATRQTGKYRDRINKLRPQRKELEAQRAEAAREVETCQRNREAAELHFRAELLERHPELLRQPEPRPAPPPELEARRAMREMLPSSWQGPRPPTHAPPRPRRGRGR